MNSTVALGARSARVRELRRLVSAPAVRREQRRFVLDGPTLLAVALGAGRRPELVVVGIDALDRHEALLADAMAAGAEVATVAPEVLASVAGTTTPNDMVSVMAWCDTALDTFVAGLGPSALVVVADRLADPGNVGTLVRSADAAGAQGVVLSEGCADVFGPKAVRASAGSVLHVATVVGADPARAIDVLDSAGVQTVATVLDAAQPYDELDLTGATALVVGSEAHGVDAALVQRARHRVSIPMTGRAESLNVSMAATVVLFEALRQRRLLGAGAPRQPIGRPGSGRSS